jgi:cell division protein FtsB
MQYKDLIQMQQEKMDRLQMTNERMHDNIAKLKSDLTRYIEKDELVSKTFDLNAT